MQNVIRVWTVFSLGLLLALSSVTATSPEEFLGGTPPPKSPPASTTAQPAKPGNTSATPAAKPAAAPAAKPAPAPVAKPAAAPIAKPAAAPAAAPSAAPAPKTAGAKSGSAKAPVSLDTAKIHLIYLDGDFEQATKALETHLKSKQPMSHADSIFAFKHLGVMLAASAGTREKGRYYMYQLINMEPTAKILDMYASDMIYLIFHNVQEDYELRRSRTSKSTVAPEPAPAQPVAPAPAPAPAPVATAAPKRSRTAYWVTGGAVLAVGTAGLLFILLDNPKPTTHTIVVNQ